MDIGDEQWLELSRNNHIAFRLARSNAIDAYSKVEIAIQGVLRELIGCDPLAAQVIFYSVISTRIRHDMMKELAKTRFGGFYSPFFRSYEKWLRDLDYRRNHIVHWIEGSDSTPSDSNPAGTIEYFLFPGQERYISDGPSKKVEHRDLDNFIIDANKLQNVSRVLFISLLTHNKPNPPAWREVFLDPVNYKAPGDFLKMFPRRRPRPKE
jgi:hypothetical protein